ncbi:HNH endonuclease family protein [Microbulbifer bruguierae]|uniref:HNH endonuclease family protein n=1 Tax=Microbulbifer bruguierae TaxID=3029061 RepID=A0ABY8NE28_9GAMM|nr:HNH endonuclease family protein [Microbulbifer bruguierae]WGL17171.1 HNH endonuclease family protein [Microbulbifer bruguierae]
MRFFFTQSFSFSAFLFLRPLVASTLIFAGSSLAQEYDRREWLPHWSDVDRDCQDTRHELLIRHSLAPVVFTGRSQCKVAFGLWLDPYTGNFYEKASDLDVEHIVPLKWAHDHGAAGWSTAQKRKFAEDPDNLWLVDDGRNQSKGDRGPDRWMPPYGPVRRYYIQRFMAVAEKYNLKSSAEELHIYLALLESRQG